MLKIIRYVLYGVAITAGVAGMAVGGIPQAKYLLEMLRDSNYGYYYDASYLNEPQIVFLLSLILLVGVRIAMALDKGSRPAGPLEAGSHEKKPAAPAPSNEISPPSTAAEPLPPPAETADEKLTRLLNKKQD